ncbi:hypothetical protein M0813_22822 [Anaeramoeba flamelloides]|uniref:Proteasome assembly chaperone 1 n=1 Tax=Anaeramoeba flamelloides TaxID=1746091 RepID=A0ABQ8YBW7_9EUKA|nr:hypothetical protein M0813_22822 [Anaeramoeba flamelloides]
MQYFLYCTERELVHSKRNFDEYEEIEEEPELPKLPELKLDKEFKIEKIWCLIAGLSEVGCSFLISNFPKCKPIGKIIISQVKQSFDLYFDNGKIFILIPRNVHPDFAKAVANILINKFQPARVLAIGNLAADRYASNFSCQVPMLRMIQTDEHMKLSQEKTVQKVLPLEPPNFLDNFAASLMVVCQIKSIPGCTLLSLQDRQELAIETLIALEEPAFTILFKDEQEINPERKKMYVKEAKKYSFRPTSGLYL